MDSFSEALASLRYYVTYLSPSAYLLPSAGYVSPVHAAIQPRNRHDYQLSESDSGVSLHHRKGGT